MAVKNAEETYLRPILRNVGKCWKESYKYVKQSKGNGENILAIKDCNCRFITDSIDKDNSLNSYYISAFGCKRNIPQRKQTPSDEPFTINITIITKRLAVIRRNNSIGPDGTAGKSLQLGGEAMIPYFVWLLDITISNAAVPSGWKRATEVPIYKAGERSVVTNCRPVSLTSVVCKQTEHVITGYLKQV